MYRARFTIATSLAIIGVALIFSLALIPSYLAVQLASAPVEPAVKDAHATPNDATTVSRAQALVSQISPVLSATSSATAVIKAAIKDRPAGVTLSHFAYTPGEGTAPGELLISGEAAREKVAAYRDALSADPLFKGVTVPVGALVGNEGGHFSMTLTGDF